MTWHTRWRRCADQNSTPAAASAHMGMGRDISPLPTPATTPHTALTYVCCIFFCFNATPHLQHSSCQATPTAIPHHTWRGSACLRHLPAPHFYHGGIFGMALRAAAYQLAHWHRACACRTRCCASHHHLARLPASPRYLPDAACRFACTLRCNAPHCCRASLPPPHGVYCLYPRLHCHARALQRPRRHYPAPPAASRLTSLPYCSSRAPARGTLPA